jgi:serine/threonine-protein kinase PpkA
MAIIKKTEMDKIQTPCTRIGLYLKGFQRALTFAMIGFWCLGTGLVQADYRTPLPLDKNPDLFQRVITLPNARLLKKPNKSSEVLQSEVPIFSVYYVFGREGNGDLAWTQVGRAVKDQPEGWIAAKFTQDWSIMLVMQYAPPGQRERVLFFEDADTLTELVLSPRARQKTRDLLAVVDKGRHAGTGVIAVEETQKGFPQFGSNPYLMPILNAHREQFDDGTSTTLAEIASISAEVNLKLSSDVAAPIAKARRAIVFVIDSTTSMGPYIERARQTARRIYQEMGSGGFLERTSFGLVGYRNNMDEEPQRSGLGYVSRVFQDLDPASPPDGILASLDQIEAANVSTHSWDEDVVAGLYDALWGMNWEPFQELRLIILITDAGGLSGEDPKAKHHAQRIDFYNIKQKAIDNNVVILPIHLLTPEAKHAGNIESARQQYQGLARTGDKSVSKYLAIDAGSVALFAQQLNSFAGELGAVVKRASRGIAEQKPKLEPSQSGFTMGSLFRNEVYSAQQRYLGDVQGAEAAVFYRAWASDKDLTQPKRASLEVDVFLTRNQLNELAQSLDRLVKRAKRALDSPETFFDRLRALAVATATDPERYGAGFANIAESGLLPSYISLLPYKSWVLGLTNDIWRDLGAAGQNEMVIELEKKVRTYQDINEDRRNWTDLGARDPGLEVHPISLEILP